MEILKGWKEAKSPNASTFWHEDWLFVQKVLPHRLDESQRAYELSQVSVGQPWSFDGNNWDHNVKP